MSPPAMRGAPRPRIIVTSGPGSEPVDDVRRITNHSTGELGSILAEVLAAAGAEVVCLEGYGATVRCDPAHARVVPFRTNDDLLAALATLQREGPEPAAVLHAAALCDFRVATVETLAGDAVRAAKLDSRAGGLRITLEPAPKVIAALRGLFPRGQLVGWKFEMTGGRADLLAKAARQFAENATDLCVINGPAYGEGFGVCTPAGDCLHVPDKTQLARHLAARFVAPAGSRPVAADSGLPPRQGASPDSTMNPSHLRQAVAAVLEQGLTLLNTVDHPTYTERLPQAFNASIGGHYRHCLDHFEILLGSPGALVDYDARRRDEQLERDLGAARAATERLLAATRALTDERLAAAVHVRCKVAYGEAESPVVASSFAREAMYAIVHAIHHYALISVMCRIMELPLPKGFGVAPSTVQYQESAGAR